MSKVLLSKNDNIKIGPLAKWILGLIISSIILGLGVQFNLEMLCIPGGVMTGTFGISLIASAAKHYG